MIVTKAPEPSFAFPQDHPIEGLPEPVVELTTEQKLALAEAEKRDQQRRREWASIVQALEDDSMAVFRAMRRFRSEGEPERVERVLTSFEEGRFLIDRMGAECAVDQDLAVVLLDLRHRLQAEYGNGPAAIMLIDRAVSAYHDFVRVTGWIGNLSIHIEHEFFGRDGPSAEFRDRWGKDGYGSADLASSSTCAICVRACCLSQSAAVRSCGRRLRHWRPYAHGQARRLSDQHR